jgi:regulator of RNase E activity RraA
VPEWNSEQELLELVRRELYTAVIGDVCDQVGLRRQFLSPSVRPLDPGGYGVLAGRAMTVLEADLSGEDNGAPPFGLMFRALDDLRPGEIYLASGSRCPYALFGELMSTAAFGRGAAGAVCNGYIRDTAKVLALGFPVYCHGSYAQDQRVRGKVVDFRVPLEVDGVSVAPGDLVVGDLDGVLVVPAQAAEEVFAQALAKARLESGVKAALRRGMRAEAAFREFGVF